MRAQRFWIWAIVVAVLTAPAALHAQAPVGTAFTYQAQLKQAGEPLNDTADFEFTLWDDPTSTDPSHQVGPMVPVDNVSVGAGLFTVVLDFGVIPFTTNEARWLEIAVRSPSGGGEYTTLEPRQALTPTPFSLATRGISVDAIGNVGIGTPSPAARLDVMGTALVEGFRMPPGAVGGYVLTTDDFGVANWQPPGEFTLPFEGSVASQQPAMKIINTGEGKAIVGRHNLSGNFGYVGGSAASVYGEAPDGSFGALAGWVDIERGPVRVGGIGLSPDYGVYGEGDDAGGYFKGTGLHSYGVQGVGVGAGGYFKGSGTSSGKAYVGDGNIGIRAEGSYAGAIFEDADPNDSGYAEVAIGDYGIKAHGSDMGGYFTDNESSPTGYAEVGVPNYGIRAHGDDTGGFFQGDADYGIDARGHSAGGYFRGPTGPSGFSSAFIAYFHYGVYTQGEQVGGYFENGLGSGQAFVGISESGIEGFGDYRGGGFQDGDDSTWTDVASGTSSTSGNGSKDFVQNHPYDPEKVIVYTCLEGDEVGTYTRGTARLVDGVARVPLGETFEWVTNPDIGLTAHLTPRGNCEGLYVESLSTSEIVVRELRGGTSDVTFDYIVHGLRIGFEEVSVVREKDREASIPSMSSHRERYEMYPELQRFNALERFKRMRASIGEPEPLDLSVSQALRDLVDRKDAEIAELNARLEAIEALVAEPAIAGKGARP